MVVINVLFYVQYRLEHHQAKEDLEKRFHESERILHMSRMDRLPFIEAKERLYTILQVELLHEDEVEDLTDAKIIKRNKGITIYLQNKNAYFVLEDPRRSKKLHLRYANYEPKQNHLIMLALLINLAVFIFYLYVAQRLKPLSVLKKRIAHFAEGNLEIVPDIKGKDEIAEVSKEFNNAVKKITTLQDSRKLFLRNIMHELKTPIAKGKLITDLMEDPKNQERLKRIFLRFEYLLGEFTKIERVTSNVMVLHKKRYRVIDILDNAFDILMVEFNTVEIEISANLEIEADYELMSIALKNLIDNAMKYGKDRAKIIIEKERIIVQSSGEAIENLSFDKVFNRKYEGSDKGLGLGLYITKNIVDKHQYSLLYEHEEGMNRFIVVVI